MFTAVVFVLFSSYVADRYLTTCCAKLVVHHNENLPGLLTCIGMLELPNRIKQIMTCNLSSDNIWQNDSLCRDESAFGGIRISRWIAHYWSRSDDWGLGDTQQALYLNSPADPNWTKFDQFRNLNWIRYMCTRNQWPGTSPNMMNNSLLLAWHTIPRKIRLGICS